MTRWVCPSGHPLELVGGEGTTRLWRCPIDEFTHYDKDLVAIQKQIDPGWVDPEPGIELSGSVTLSKLAAISIQGHLRKHGLVNDELDSAIRNARELNSPSNQ